MKAILAPWLLLGAAGSALAQQVGTLADGVAVVGMAPVMSCQSLAKMAHAKMTPPAPLQPCVAAVTLKSGRGSDVKMELWMPSSEWNGKLMIIGNYGSSGSIPRSAMAEPLAHGYAVAAADGAGAVHDTAVKARALTAAYYGGTPRYTYWISSSAGGTEDLIDFDGIVLGAPASAITPGLAAFKLRGGKIIQYHDGSDSAVSAERSVENFERVVASQGGFEPTAAFYRLFLITAPEHANESFSMNWIATLEEWVERGRAPESVLAKHLPPPNSVMPPPPPGAVVFEPPFGVRVMCAYPRIAQLQGGLGEVPVDWICQPGPRGPKVDK